MTLEHRDPGLSLPLFVAADGAELGGQWRIWGEVLGLPLLVLDADGTLRDPFSELPRVTAGASAPRRRRRTALAKRRPTIVFRRRAGSPRGMVHRGEREIIARS